MKTTVDLPESLLKQAKRKALQNNTSLRALMISGLKEKLASPMKTVSDPIEQIRNAAKELWRGIKSGSLRARIAQKLEITRVFWDTNLFVYLWEGSVRTSPNPAGWIQCKCSLEHITGAAIFFDGYEREDYRSAQPSCDSFPAGAHAGGNAFSHGFSFLRSTYWRRLAERGDHRIDQPARKRGKRIARSCLHPRRLSRSVFCGAD